MTQTYDIAVLGATPAGYAAAYCLAKAKRSVVVIDSPRESVESPLADWVPGGFFGLRGLAKTLEKAAGAESFHDVTYHDAALARTAEHHSRAPAGYFMETRTLVSAMAAAATKAGAKTRSSTTSPAIRLEEDQVQVLGSAPIACRMLIVAQNRPEDIISDLSLPMRNVPQSSILAAGLDVPLSPKTPAKLPTPGLHVLQSAQRGEIGMFFRLGQMLHIRLIRLSETPLPYAAQLSTMVSSIQRSGLVGELSLGKARGAVWHPPAGVALELDTHVAKRCLLTGTAGGFADSITGGTLTPSVRSALLAADAAQAALDSDEPQNALMHYKTSWRKTLAELLRPPNTSLAMLMPLLFVNHRIVAKFTQALLHGESI